MTNEEKFPVGSLVMGNGWRPEHAQFEKSWRKGVVVHHDGNGITTLVLSVPDIHGKIKLVYTRYLKTAGVLIPKGAPVRQRCGRPARIDEYSDLDCDRPILAYVVFADGTERRLSYSKYGYFYKSEELPVDLVPL